MNANSVTEQHFLSLSVYRNSKYRANQRFKSRKMLPKWYRSTKRKHYRGNEMATDEKITLVREWLGQFRQDEPQLARRAAGPRNRALADIPV